MRVWFVPLFDSKLSLGEKWNTWQDFQNNTKHYYERYKFVLKLYKQLRNATDPRWIVSSEEKRKQLWAWIKIVMSKKNKIDYEFYVSGILRST